MQDIVNEGAQIFDGCEQMTDKLYKRVSTLRKVFEDAHAAGMNGSLAAGRIDGEICAIMGLLGEVKRRLYTLHREGTDMADAHGVDIPQPRGGGGR